MQILITGATGLIGKKIGMSLAKQGHHITVISRHQKKAKKNLPFPCEVIEGDLSQSSIQALAHMSFDAVIHLLGESVAEGRWTTRKKMQILHSRVQSTQNLIASLGTAPQIFLSASAIGFYGDRADEVLSEEDKAGTDFLADVCKQWEDAIFAVKKKFPDTRVVAGRIGIVLDVDGGALPKMAYPFRLGIGGALATGRQWMSWIHIRDLLGVIEFCLFNQNAQGAINFVAPEPVTNMELSRELAKHLCRPLGLKVPALALKMLYGELADALVASQKVSCQKIQTLGYRFQFHSLAKAFADLCKDWKNGQDVFVAEQYIAAPPEQVFRFFAEARNLEQITPTTLKFHVLNMSTREMEEGTLIDYKLKLYGLPLKWRTLIADWQPCTSFVDTQLKGPYHFWHHTHVFEAMGSGTLMRDCVRYQLPLGYLGWLVAGLWVKSDVQKIFDYRRNIISEMKF